MALFYLASEGTRHTHGTQTYGQTKTAIHKIFFKKICIWVFYLHAMFAVPTEVRRDLMLQKAIRLHINARDNHILGGRTAHTPNH